MHIRLYINKYIHIIYIHTYIKTESLLDRTMKPIRKIPGTVINADIKLCDDFLRAFYTYSFLHVSLSSKANSALINFLSVLSNKQIFV